MPKSFTLSNSRLVTDNNLLSILVIKYSSNNPFKTVIPSISSILEPLLLINVSNVLSVILIPAILLISANTNSNAFNSTAVLSNVTFAMSKPDVSSSFSSVSVM